MKLFAVILGLSLYASAQSPAGWQVMKDKKQLCQISVPQAWTADKIMPGSLTAGDKKASLIFGSKPTGITYVDIVKMAKDMFKPVKMFEEGANRTWFASAPKKGSSWYAVINTSPVCEVQIDFQDPGFEATAKQVVNSLKVVK